MKPVLKNTLATSLLVFLLSGCGEDVGSASDPSSSSSAGFVVVDSLRISGGWYTFNDNTNGGKSTLRFLDSVAGPGLETAVQLDANLQKGALSYDPSVGAALRISADGSPYAGLTYLYQGAAHQIRAEIAEVGDYCFHYVQVPASRTWTQVHIAWADFVQEGWGAKVPFSPRNIVNLSWIIKGADQTQDSLLWAAIAWADSSQLPVPEPDFVIRPAGGPDSVAIGSLTIAHPLQKTAEQYLSQGINLTNWLEEDHGFTGFAYNEATIKKIAALGFKGLRLPIDLDQYVKNKDAFLAGTAQFQLDSNLFVPLDSFQVWTRRHGLSFTIDYHQYDGGFTAASSTNARYRQMMKALWACVAKRYAHESRPDLFYELLNEPDADIASAVWHGLAQELIDTIRSVDATRPLLFGAVNWYRIPELVDNTPFADPNIIYVFHFYEPFLYTHQGAPWDEDMATVRNIAFPYDPARWGNTYQHFGARASWVTELVDNYPDYGNRNAMKALLYQAKAWAVRNNVPVICNEFGANTFQGTPADRLVWLSTTVDLMEELRIPWQHWGYDNGNEILDSQGNLLTGLDSAFHLR